MKANKKLDTKKIITIKELNSLVKKLTNNKRSKFIQKSVRLDRL